MAYGENIRQLNPLEPQQLAQTLERFCPQGGRVLDVGCGRGTTLSWLARHTAYQVQGLEPDPDYAALCGAVQGLAQQLPFAERSFDAVLMECVFSLLDQGELAAGEVWRVLRPGGVLLLSDLYARQGQAQLGDNRLLRHIYAAEDLSGFFTRIGFTQAEFIDHSFALKSLLAQMIMDGAACACLDPDSRQILRQVRAGYGLWAFVKPGGAGES